MLPLTSAPPAPRPPLPVPLIRPITAEEYRAMAQAGILRPGERVELLGGQILPMAAIHNPHVFLTNRLNEHFAAALYGENSRRAHVSVQNPIRLSDVSESEPDVALLVPDYETQETPLGPADVLLLVEVADSTLERERDRDVKRPLYAAAGIVEVWIVDVQRRYVEVAREPSARGYRSVERVSEASGRGGAPEALPGLPPLDVAVLFRGITG
jgi:Uma2 family endonuclease